MSSSPTAPAVHRSPTHPGEPRALHAPPSRPSPHQPQEVHLQELNSPQLTDEETDTTEELALVQGHQVL